MAWLLVALGAAVGAPSRFLVDRAVQRYVVENHPKRIALGTLTVNVLGSAILGLVMARLDSDWGLLLGTGFCGAFTTFSTFAAQTDESIREDWPVVGILNVVLSVALCFGVFWLTWSVLS
ncbi:MAG: fluoride efflux transporter CrcB [Actinomycetia bacterium]|nr:fluoride efflux transporter CrcB [Actinomycetes bacterium]